LNPVDRAKAFERLSLEFGLSTNDISQRISKSPAYVSNTLRLLKLPDALKDGLLTGIISEGHARALAAIEDDKAMVEVYKVIMREGGSVRRAEELARRYKKDTGTGPKKTQAQALIVSDKLDQMQEDLTKKLGDNVNAKLRRSRVETKLIITMKGSLENTDPQLENIFNALMGS
jgi:ParB family transcriptional regulator, chromosome partitioning protein